MKTISVYRKWFTDKTTISELFMPDATTRFCYCLEDTCRRNTNGNQQAIPPGTYPLIIDRSQRFGVNMPHILNVPDNDGVFRKDRGIRIHAGNDHADTKGCLLLGLGKLESNDGIISSRAAMESFMEKLTSLLRMDKVQISVNGGRLTEPAIQFMAQTEV